MTERPHSRRHRSGARARDESAETAAAQSGERGTDPGASATENKDSGTEWRDPDQVAAAEGWTKELARELKQRSKDPNMWIRLLFMVMATAIFLVVYTWLVWFVVIFQFLSKLFTGKINPQLLAASERLVGYAGDILAFVLYRTEQRPWPFGSKET